MDSKKLILSRFNSLTPIQQETIPKILSGQHILISAPTGSGKTESALLPALERYYGNDPITILYITPLRALSRDLKERIGWWCEQVNVKYDLRTGDTTQSERTRHRKKPPHVLLTTVESLQALLMGKVMKLHLKNIKCVIVDEVHDILDNKRGAQLSMALERLQEIASFQRIAISATLADLSEAAKLIFGRREYVVCKPEIDRKFKFEVREKNIDDIAKECSNNRTLLFVNTRSTAEELSATLKEMEVPIAVHHGSLSKEVRITTEKQFKEGELKSILCTSSLELGIDVGDVSQVIQYGSPHQVFRLIQRVGRSGHSLDKTPKGILYYSDFDDQLECEVICAFANSGKIEKKTVEQNALDVISHQIIGILLDRGRSKIEEIHAILSRSYAYNVSLDKLKKIALQLYSQRLIFYDETEEGTYLNIKSRARRHYYTFLSTIPKEKRFVLVDMTTKRKISSLDEEFVINLETGSCFLSQGKPWRVVDITEEEVIAEPWIAETVMIPTWTGEDIPVSYEIAQEVGKMRRIKDITPLPDHKTVVFEQVGETIIIHACFGHRVNETLSRILAHKLSEKISETVFSVVDPYRILLKLPFRLKLEHVVQTFKSIADVKRELKGSLEGSSLVRFKFQHVGRLFGLLDERGHASNRYIAALKNSVIYEETIRTILFRYFDVEKAEEIICKVKTGEIELIEDVREKPSFFAQIGLNRVSGGESVGAFSPKEVIATAFLENAYKKSIILECMSCHATQYIYLGNAKEIKCHKCGSKYLAFKDSEKKEEQAPIIAAHGKRALIALSTYGIGAKTASRILKKLHRNDEELALDLLEAQRNFVKNKKYWKKQ